MQVIKTAIPMVTKRAVEMVVAVKMVVAVVAVGAVVAVVAVVVAVTLDRLTMVSVQPQ